MKKQRIRKKFLEELCDIPNVSAVCQKLGIARNTIYRWRNEDPIFRGEMDASIRLGELNVNDLANNRLVSNVQNNKPWAIRYWLDNHDKNYIRPRLTSILNELEDKRPIQGFEVIVRHAKNEPTSSRGPIRKQDDELYPS